MLVRLEHYSTVGIRRRFANGILEKRLASFYLKVFFLKRLSYASVLPKMPKNLDANRTKLNNNVIISSFEGTFFIKFPVKTEKAFRRKGLLMYDIYAYKTLRHQIFINTPSHHFSSISAPAKLKASIQSRRKN